MELDIHSVEELGQILVSLREITSQLVEALSRHSLLTMKIYKKLAEQKISGKLSMESKLVELIGAGEEEAVNEYIESETEVSKLKYHQRYAVEALNTKKHINNCLPK
jgi:hypothetical protein